jgi:hypothetical protein
LPPEEKGKMSTSIPFLPGNSIRTTKANNNKKHLFDLHNGLQVINDVEIQNNSLEEDLSIAQHSADFDATQRTQAHNGNMTTVPSWVINARMVLSFEAYFKEAVVSSAVETFRVRKVRMYYYLEDESMDITEPKVENSGIPQGVFCKRHRIVKPDNTYVGLDDLRISKDIEIYGRTFRIYDADKATRNWFNERGIDLGPEEEVPRDTFSMKNTNKQENHNKIMYQMKRHMEASLGKMMSLNVDASKKFLEFDRQVLRFQCVWHNTKYYGESRPFTLHFFLADDCVEVLDVPQANSGRDQFPVFLKKQRLPKDFKKTCPDISKIGVTDQSVQYYKDSDLMIGQEVDVYGRRLLICGCDEFTKQHYLKNYPGKFQESDFDNLLDDDVEQEALSVECPPSTGFGSEEDSLGSFLYLIPKVPKKDYKKEMQMDKIKLAFQAKLHNAAPEDKDRRFSISFFRSKDELAIYENVKRNSGFIGGSFLKSDRYLNPDTGEYFQHTDFKTGAILTINKWKFELLESDEWTKNYMAQNPEMYNQAAPATEVEGTEVEGTTEL